MRSRDKSQAVVVVEGLRDVLTERVSRATGGDTPSTSVIGVTPQKITHWSLMRNLLYPVKRPNVVERIDGWRKTSMQAEDLVLDQGGKWEEIEEVGEVLPDVRVAIFAQALVIEAIDLGDLSRFVVATENGDALRVSDLESYEESDSFDREVTSVNIVTHEEIICVWVGSTDLEQLHQVVELTVYVSTNCHWAFHWLHIRLFLQNLSRLIAKSLYILF